MDTKQLGGAVCSYSVNDEKRELSFCQVLTEALVVHVLGGGGGVGANVIMPGNVIPGVLK